MYNIYIYTLSYRKRNTVISVGNALLKIGIRFVDRGPSHKIVYTYMYACPISNARACTHICISTDRQITFNLD